MSARMKKHVLLVYGSSLLLFLLLLWYPLRSLPQLPEFELLEERLETLSKEEELVKQDVKFIRRFYGLSNEQYEEASVYRPASTMEAIEIAVFQGVDTSLLRSACEKRVQQQQLSFAGYGEIQSAQLAHALYLQDDTKVILIVHEDPSSIKALLTQKEQEGLQP